MQYDIKQWIARSLKGWELMRKTKEGEREERTKKLEEEQIQTGQQEQAYEEGEEQFEQNQEQAYEEGEEQWEQNQEQVYEEGEEQWEQNQKQAYEKREEQFEQNEEKRTRTIGVPPQPWEEAWHEQWKIKAEAAEAAGEDWEAVWQDKWEALEQYYLVYEPMPDWYQPGTEVGDEDYAQAHWERQHAAFDQMMIDTWEDRIQVERKKQQKQAHLDRIEGTIDQTHLSPFLIKEEIYQGLKGVEVCGQNRVEFDYYTDIDINEAGIGQLCCVVASTRDEFGYWSNSDNPKPGLDGPWYDRSLSILSPVNCLKEADRFVITHSPMDALSHRQLERTGVEGWREVVGAKQASVSYDQQTTVYIGLGGAMTEEKRKYLETIFKLAYEQGKTVVLAPDKDMELPKDVGRILKEIGTSYHIEKPTLELSWRNTIELFPSTSQMFEEIDTREVEREIYQASVLPQLGIEQETLRGFKDQVKVTQWSVEMPLHPIGVTAQIQTTQPAVINNQEVGVEKPTQAVVDSWSLSVDQQGSIQLSVSEGLPPLAILKGDPLQASKLVLVGSPLDALLHYQAQHQIYRDKGTLDYRKSNLASLASTCYMYVGQKDSTSAHPFEAVTQMFKDKSLSLAIRGDQDIRFDSLETSLQQQGVFCHKEPIDTNALVYKKLNLLANLLQGVTGARGVGEEGDEEEQQQRNINKKKGYRPKL